MRRSFRLAALVLVLAAATPFDAFAQRTFVIAPPGSSAFRPRISGDGATVAWVNYTSGAINLIRIDGSDLRTVPGAVVSYDMALSGDGSRLVYNTWGTSPPLKVFILDTLTLATTRLSGSEDAYLPTISDDGSVVAWDNVLGWTVVNADGSNLRVIAPALAAGITWGPSLTADGSVLAGDAESPTDFTLDAYRADTSGPGMTQLTGAPGYEIGVRISDDGSKILYGTHPNLMAVIAANGDGTGAIDLSAGAHGSAYDGEGHETHDLSGDGRIAVFTRGGPIIVARTDGTWHRQIGIGNETHISGSGDVVVARSSGFSVIAIGVPGVSPDEIHNLEFAPDAATISWEGRPSANVYNLYRGDVPGLRAGTPAACLAANVTSAGASDPSTPATGEGWYYLVTGESGGGEGISGRTSAGTPRSVTGSCPPADADADGTPDAADTCPLLANVGQADTDGDGIGDACDNCAAPNPEQFDAQNDGLGEGAPPIVQVTSPNGAEVLTVGENVTLTWTSSDDCIASRTATILLSRDGPGGPFETIATDVPDTGSYVWTITGPVTQGPKAYVSVEVNDGWSRTLDLSDGAFRIR